MALVADTMRHTTTVSHRLAAVPVKAATVIYAGGGVCTDANGLAVPAADAAGLVSVGLARYGYDNTTGSDGVISDDSERFVEVDTGAVASYTVAGGTPGAGRLAYWVDDDNVSADPGVNAVVAGRFVQPNPLKSGHWLVDHLRV